MSETAARRPGIVPVEGLAHVRGETQPPLSDLTIDGLLRASVQRCAEREAVVFREQGVRLTWAQFDAQVQALASGLAGLGLEAGDRVGIWSPNRLEWLVTQFATARMGAILVNINPSYRLHELGYALKVSGCRAVVAAEKLKTSMYLEMLEKVRPDLPGLQFLIRMGPARTPGMLNYDDLVADGARRAFDPPVLHCHEPINIQFTSGTTGNAKGATLTHHNVVNNGRYIALAMRFTEADSLCIPVPLYHCFGMVLAVLACVATGAKMVFPGESFDPEAALATVSDERCTALHGVPTMFIAELAHPRFAEFDLTSLRTGIMAGSPCPIETMKQVVSRMHMDEVTIAYGMTETSPVSFQTLTTDPLDRRVTTVGRVQPH
ncbi:MAG TPA: AMP-binding protein, partial [Burkholderiaceae bacterium]|nr:AMP-binding protein [Burkholderiaceae bacterium]